MPQGAGGAGVYVHRLVWRRSTLIEILLFFSTLLFASPLLTGFAAHERGRSFWTWFFVGGLLPAVSLFVLFALERDRDAVPPPVR